jgi:hypothetical protein
MNRQEQTCLPLSASAVELVNMYRYFRVAMGQCRVGRVYVFFAFLMAYYLKNAALL